MVQFSSIFLEQPIVTDQTHAKLSYIFVPYALFRAGIIIPTFGHAVPVRFVDKP